MKVPYIYNELKDLGLKIERERREFAQTEVDGNIENPYWDTAMATLKQALGQIRILCHQELLAGALSKMTQRR